MTSRSAESGGSRSWILLDTYRQVLARRIEDFYDEGFVHDNGLAFREPRADRVVIKGRIRCQNYLFIDAETTLAVRIVRGRKQVRPARYKYQAGIEGPQVRSIFRYDNSHAYIREGQPDPHHKHRFDHTTWKEVTPPEWIGEARAPHLSDVIEELRDWWETTGRHLDLGQE